MDSNRIPEFGNAPNLPKEIVHYIMICANILVLDLRQDADVPAVDVEKSVRLELARIVGLTLVIFDSCIYLRNMATDQSTLVLRSWDDRYRSRHKSQH